MNLHPDHLENLRRSGLSDETILEAGIKSASPIINKPCIFSILEREGVDLKKRERNWWALCPLHSEKTPSFCVSEEKQAWHCFGCGKGGDVISFIMAYRGLSFKEALTYLGMGGGKVKIDSREVKKRELVKAFSQLISNYCGYLCDEYQCLNGMMAYIKTENDLECYAPIFPEITEAEYQLDVLQYGTDEDKYLLLKEEGLV